MAVEARAAAEGRPYLQSLKREAAKVLHLLGLQEHELSVVLCDDGMIRQLNRDFRDKDKPTDVLSFEQAGGAMMPPEAAPQLLGDVVISLDTASWQALALGQSLRERLRTLLIHGILHLIGYDHERSPAEARRMFARERELAAVLDGLNPPTPKRRVLPTAPPILSGTADARKRVRRTRQAHSIIPAAVKPRRKTR